MSYDPIIREVQNEFSTFVVEEAVWPEDAESTEEPIELHCGIAEIFWTWCLTRLNELQSNASEAWINTYELELQHRYREWFKQAPKKCRNYKGAKNNKKCIHAVWLDTLDKMEAIRLSQKPIVTKEEAEVVYVRPQETPISGAPIGLFPKVSANDLDFEDMAQ